MGRLLPGLIVFLAFVLYLVSERVGQPPRHAPDTVVRFWGFSYPAQTMLELKSDFEAENPDIRVEVQNVPWSSLQQKTLWAVAAQSNVPDVIVGSSAWIGGLAANGALLPLDGLLEPEFFQGLHPAALGIYQFPDPYPAEGRRGRTRQFGVPLDLDLPLVFHRADLTSPVLMKLGMSEFPEDWEGLLRVAREFRGRKNAAGQSLHFMVLDPEDPVPLQMAFLPAAGGALLAPGLREARFNDTAGQAAFGMYRHLMRDGNALRWNRSTQGDPMLPYKTDRAAVTINGPWLAKYLQSKAPEQSGRWRIAFMPRLKPDHPVAGLGGACVAIPVNAPNRNAALKLIRFMATERFGRAYFKRVGSIPPLRAAWSAPEFDSPEPYFGGQNLQAMVREAIDRSAPLQLLPDSEILRGPVRRALSQVCDSDLPIGEILDRAAAETDALLRQ